ncbi:hypothetical protein D3C76_479720 [compost metagenome]
MYFPESTQYYRDDFSNSFDDRDKALFMHEMTHVWQYQLGYAVKRHGLTVSSQGMDAYRYTLNGNGTISDYNMEQQGEIISDYFIICIIGNPQRVWISGHATKDPALLASTVDSLLNDPHNNKHLPT